MAKAGRPKAEGIQHICSAIVAVVIVGLSSTAVAKKGEKSAKCTVCSARDFRPPPSPPNLRRPPSPDL